MANLQPPKFGDEAIVTGKGGKQRRIKFTYDTARALNYYQRERARHRWPG
jgi:hypothetical protein